MSFLILDGQLLLIYQTKSIEPMNKAIQHLIKQLKYDCSSTERPWTYVCIVWLVKVAVRLGQKIRETVKGKLNLGAKILQVGGLRKVYKQLFSVREGEKLLKACQCHLSTTTGPLAGLLFISTHKLAFCSDKSLKFSSPTGELLRFHYKVVIPVGRIESVNESKNVMKPSQKYLEIVTVDNFDFWFMGFQNFQKTFRFLQQAISQDWKINC